MIPKSNFDKLMRQYNGLDLAGFTGWAFRPGMLFKDTQKWWGDMDMRKSPHEGIDIAAYETEEGAVVGLDGTIKIPALYGGVVEGIVEDYIGKSIFIGHNLYEDYLRFFTIYGHTIPLKNISEGTIINQGQLIATISDTDKIPPHLHLTAALLPFNTARGSLSWGLVAGARLLDPRELILV